MASPRPPPIPCSQSATRTAAYFRNRCRQALIDNPPYLPAWRTGQVSCEGRFADIALIAARPELEDRAVLVVRWRLETGRPEPLHRRIAEAHLSDWYAASVIVLLEAHRLDDDPGTAVGRTVGDLGLLLDPPVGKRGVLADDVDQLGAALEHAEGAIAGVRRDAEIEGLLLPPLQDVGLAHACVGGWQNGVGAGARTAVHGTHAPDTARLVGAQPDHGMPALQTRLVAGVGLDAVSFKPESRRSSTRARQPWFSASFRQRNCRRNSKPSAARYCRRSNPDVLRPASCSEAYSAAAATRRRGAARRGWGGLWYAPSFMIMRMLFLSWNSVRSASGSPSIMMRSAR